MTGQNPNDLGPNDTDQTITELEQRLRRLCAVADPVPPAAVRAAVASFTWRTIDADLAALVYDSAMGRGEPVLVRGSTQPRLLTFDTGALTVEMELTPVGSGFDLVGQLVPPQPAQIEIRDRSGRSHRVVADDLGRFAATAIGPGPVSLRCRPAGADADIVTDWIAL